jgi:hypothetical protein
MSLPLAAQQRSAMPSASSGKIDYERDVKPLLEQNCYSSHGDTVQQSGLRLDLRQNALRGGDYGPVILPGKSAESKLIKRLVDGDGGMQMPPTGPLSPEDIGVLRAWIDQGAEFRTTIVEAPPKPTDPRVAALVAAVRVQSADAVAKLLASDPDAAKARDAASSTLLHHAAAFGSIDTMKLLLDAGADVNAANRRRSTPLHWSLHDEAKVRLLLSRGAAINARQVEGRTPLYIAASMGQGASLVKLLLENGANPALATANGMTPLMAASVRGDVEAMKLLVEKNADVTTSQRITGRSQVPDRPRCRREGQVEARRDRARKRGHVWCRGDGADAARPARGRELPQRPRLFAADARGKLGHRTGGRGQAAARRRRGQDLRR